MKRDFLESHGLTKEQIETVMAEHGKTVQAERAKVDQLEAQVKQLTGDITARDADLAKLKESTGDAATLQQQLTELQKAYTEQRKAHEQELHDVRVTNAVQLALAGQTHDAQLVASLFDRSKIELDDTGNVKGGLADQLDRLKAEKAFLFVEPKATAPIPTGVKPAEGITRGEMVANTPGGVDLASAIAAHIKNA